MAELFPDADTAEPAPRPVPPTPLVEIMDLPPLSDCDAAPHAPWIAAYSAPFAGAAVFRASGQSGFTLDCVVEDAAVFGELAFDLHPGPVWRWDRVNDLYVDLVPGAALESREEIDVLNGANGAAIRAPSGAWEVLQWRTAELIAPDRYRLSTLLRGQRGTEHAMGAPTPAGARFVLLDGALVRSTLPLSERGLARTWRYGPAQFAFDDESFDGTSLAVDGIGLRPPAPVHLRGKLDHATHDWHLGFVRRTRIDGDSWQGLDAALGEEREAYLLEIMDGSAAVRSAVLTSPSFVYTAAMQLADFGAPRWNVAIRVAQLSTAFGPGTPAQILTFDR